ncbi:serine/threonine-protein kinase [Pseudonocardia humida]|uniref:non-specific serine/threonine protein kinase n=1 Tax=Pseudonocardia humida TaxID=2800819 RepID=A0ABT1A8T6_9PSEU|nr:serine/threonine-protein kinase [Pseudonocardia humida]MCO1659328.1 serine/threonine protein kinase [Pseudonocardia humida]
MPDQRSAAAAGWVGHVLAGHRIDALIGEGGMGVVYRATHLQLRRTVALKVLPPSLAADHEYRRRFEREAAIAASLEHPNVVPIYDAGHANGILYLSMRFVDGEDLGAVLQREGRLGVERVCALLGPVADALDAVHEAGLVHRDVKPGNVLIARSQRPRGGEQVYLCDFGIAKGAAAGSDITSAGQVFGTLQYSSPEQIEGRWLDGRSDQYGLACLAFRCLTGQVPYPRPETAAVIYAHLAADPPRLNQHRPDLPAAADAAIARATAKHPDRRFASCAAFVAALRAAVPALPRPRPGPPHPTPTPRPRPVRQENPPDGRHRPLRPTLPLPEQRESEEPTRRVERGEPVEAPVDPPVEAPVDAPVDAPVSANEPAPEPAPGPGAVPPPVDVRAERDADDRSSINVTWTAGGEQEVEYKITRRTPDGRSQVVGRTRSTSIVDGAVPPGSEIPVYEVVARLGPVASELVRSSVPTAASPADDPAPDAPPGGIPAVQHLTASTAGALVFVWPPGVTEAMVVVRKDRPPQSPDDPAATAWKITNMRYQIDGGLLLPASVDRPCHVAVASCKREGGALVVAPAFDPTARAVVGP